MRYVYEVSNFSYGVIFVSFILLFSILSLLLRCLPKQKKLIDSYPYIIIATIILDIIIVLIFDR
ncbi:hypothetical protein GCM10008915_74560 [Bifidobacterium pullorum subsp. gallinarum]